MQICATSCWERVHMPQLNSGQDSQETQGVYLPRKIHLPSTKWLADCAHAKAGHHHYSMAAITNTMSTHMEARKAGWKESENDIYRTNGLTQAWTVLQKKKTTTTTKRRTLWQIYENKTSAWSWTEKGHKQVLWRKCVCVSRRVVIKAARIRQTYLVLTILRSREVVASHIHCQRFLGTAGWTRVYMQSESSAFKFQTDMKCKSENAEVYAYLCLSFPWCSYFDTKAEHLIRKHFSVRVLLVGHPALLQQKICSVYWNLDFRYSCVLILWLLL